MQGLSTTFTNDSASTPLGYEHFPSYLAPEGPTFQIFVTDSKQTVTLDVQPTDPIAAVVRAACREFDVGEHEVWLSIYGGKPLESARVVADYNLQPLATLLLSVRLSGGGCGSSTPVHAKPPDAAVHAKPPDAGQVARPFLPAGRLPPADIQARLQGMSLETDFFYLVDINKNGSIEKDELIVAYLAIGGFTYAEIEEAFAFIDVDHDGKISREEFKRMQAVFPDGYARVCQLLLPTACLAH